MTNDGSNYFELIDTAMVLNEYLNINDQGVSQKWRQNQDNTVL